jgi:hypothetical protein
MTERIREDLSDLDRFLASVKVEPSGCWIWTGTVSGGDGQFRNDLQQLVPASRWMYEHFFRRKLRKGMRLDHLCKAKLCVNPLHMVRIVTPEP